MYLLDRVTAAPDPLPEPTRLPAQIQHISTLDEEEAQIKDFIRRQKEASVELDIPAAYSLPANRIPPELRRKQQNSSQFITSTPIPEGVEACPCGSNKKVKYCCLGKAA